MASKKDLKGQKQDAPFQFTRAGKLHFFCPLCKYHQSTSTIQNVGVKHHAQIAVLTATSALATWDLFGWNGALLYLVYWAGFEFFYRLRKRQALVCESCGFDPFLYKQDVGKARAALKQHWETRIANENLFPKLKLKNYQTARVKGDAPAPSANESASASPPPESRA